MLFRIVPKQERSRNMKWKKFLFGDIHYKNESTDRNQEVEFKLKGGLIPNLVLLGLIVGLIIWLVVW